MVVYFLTGTTFLVFFFGWLFLKARKKIVILDEEKQQLLQEKHIVVNFMHDLVSMMSAGIDRNELFQKIVQAATVSTAASSACVFECNEDILQTAAIEGLFPPQRMLPDSINTQSTRAEFIEEILKTEIFEIGEGLIGSIAKTGKAILIEDARKDPRIIKHKDPILNVRSMIVVPIIFKSNILGVLAIANPIDGGSFHKTDFSLAQSLADQASMAIYNADFVSLQIEKKRIDFDISLASSIQGMLLPEKFPDNLPLEINACYKPAQKMGGDLYDVFEIDNHRIGIAIADVSGKGIAASLLMAIAQTSLRHYAKQYDTPAEVLKVLNKEMRSKMHQEMFITMVYAVIDHQLQTITLARAGHEPPLYFNQQSLQTLSPDGMALGMSPSVFFDPCIENLTLNMHSGDTLMLYTDGINESINQDSEQFSTHRLIDAFLSKIKESPEQINQHVLDQVQAFSKKDKFMDDFTLLTIRFK